MKTIKTLIALGSVVVIASLTGCTTTSGTGSNAAYTAPKTFNYDSSAPAALTTSNPGSLFDDKETWEDNKL